MKKILLLLSMIVVFFSFFLYLYSNENQTPNLTKETKVYDNTELGLSFTYRTSPNGNTLIESENNVKNSNVNLLNLTLMRTDSYNQMIINNAKGIYHDGPPSMYLRVVSAPYVEELTKWLLDNVNVSNCEEGNMATTTLAGREGFSCLWDGLYAGITMALLYDRKILILSGVRDEPQPADVYSYEDDFNEVLESFEVK